MHLAQIAFVVRGYAELMITHYSLHVFRYGVSNLDFADRVVFLTVNGRSIEVLRRSHLFSIHQL